ncbi:hypothetical protein BKA61DRAFT_84185 [Leptodontidium sp. MPI-SDFR-AT-0119]|nr:hypothetical protein BKA61DRAFT_84185 [Leptodontidium sp. MPI-SDFR-AT-0119]
MVDDWCLHLQILLLSGAARHGPGLGTNSKDIGQPLSSINQATSPLPSLSRELADKRRQFHGDCGVVLFRGLDPDKLTRLENVICRYLYWLVFSHVWKERISSWWKDLRCWL